jgi:hypothetical protein
MTDYNAMVFNHSPEKLPEVAAVAARFTGIDGLTHHGIHDALFHGLWYLGISEGSARVLEHLCGYLSRDQWAEGQCLVWPSNARLADGCGVSIRAIQFRLRELEQAGLIARAYTHRNTRAPRGRNANREGGIDLAPLGARLPGLIAMVERDRAEAAARREASHARYEDVSLDHGTSPHHEKSDTQKQSQPIHLKETVTPFANAPGGESAASRRHADGISHEGPNRNQQSGSTKDCSPGGEAAISQFHTSTDIAVEAARKAIFRAYRASPTLRQHITEEQLLHSSIGQVLALAGGTVAAIFPERNTTHTWNWAVKRHGWRAILCLVAAVEDPSIRDPYKVFGYFASKVPAGQLDLESNLRRIETGRTPPAAPSETKPSRSELPAKVNLPAGPWGKIIKRLAGRLRTGDMGAWITPLTFVGIEDAELRLIAPTGFVRDWVTNHFADAIGKAARGAGFEVHRVSIKLRGE